jgi:hypothetical protein
LQRTRFASPGAGWPAVLLLTRPCGRIWGQDGGRWVCESILEDAHDRTVRAAAWSPGDDKLATASFDGTCVVWSCRDGEYEQIATLQGHENEVAALLARTQRGVLTRPLLVLVIPGSGGWSFGV